MAWVAKWKGKWITKRLIVYCARIFCHSFFVSAYSCFSYAFDTITVWWWCCFSYYFLFFPIFCCSCCFAGAAAAAAISYLSPRVKHIPYSTIPTCTRTPFSIHWFNIMLRIISPAFFAPFPWLRIEFYSFHHRIWRTSVCIYICFFFRFALSFVRFFFITDHDIPAQWVKQYHMYSYLFFMSSKSNTLRCGFRFIYMYWFISHTSGRAGVF